MKAFSILTAIAVLVAVVLARSSSHTYNPNVRHRDQAYEEHHVGRPYHHRRRSSSHDGRRRSSSEPCSESEVPIWSTCDDNPNLPDYWTSCSETVPDCTSSETFCPPPPCSISQVTVLSISTLVTTQQVTTTTSVAVLPTSASVLPTSASVLPTSEALKCSTATVTVTSTVPVTCQTYVVCNPARTDCPADMTTINSTVAYSTVTDTVTSTTTNTTTQSPTSTPSSTPTTT